MNKLMKIGFINWKKKKTKIWNKMKLKKERMQHTGRTLPKD